MELRHLRYFVAVAEEEHVGRAARRLHVSASPLSRQIRQLEEELAVPLFDRVGRDVRLSRAGAAFLPRVRALVADLERAAQEARSVERGEAGRLALAFVDTQAYARAIPEVIQGVRERHPQLAVEVSPMPSHDQLDALRAGRLDAGFVHERPLDASLACAPLFVERVLLAVPRGHRLARARAVSAPMLKDEPFVWTRGPKSRVLQDVEDALRGEGVALKVAVEAHSSSETRLSLVASGMGLTFCVESAGAALPPQVVLRPLSGLRLEGRAYLAWRASDTARPLLRSLRAVTRKVLRRRSARA